MDISKIQFGQLSQAKGIDKSFEDLDVNNDGKINEKDISAAQNTAIAKDIQTILNSVDPEPEIVEDTQDLGKDEPLEKQKEQTDNTISATSSATSTVYVEGQGINIYNFGKMIAEVLNKIRWDKEVNAQYESTLDYSSPLASRQVRDDATHRFEFAVDYILKNGTEDQKKALNEFYPNKSSKAIAHRIKGFFQGEQTSSNGRLRSRQQSRKTYSLANFVTNMGKCDNDENGFITLTEYDGKMMAAQLRLGTGTGKYLTTDGKIEQGKWVEDSDNVYGGGTEDKPAKAISDVTGFSATTVNGVKIYNITFRDLRLGGTGAYYNLFGANDIHLSQNEVEKLAEYFSSTGENATLEGALSAMGVKANTQTYTENHQVSPKTTFDASMTTYSFTGESGLESHLATGKYQQNWMGKQDKTLENLKLVVQAILNRAKG